MYILSVTDFDQKGAIFEERVHAGLYFDILHADRSPNAVRFHVGTTQVDFEVDHPPPANSPPGDLMITMVKETVILSKKRVSKIEKKVVSLIDLKVVKARKDHADPDTVGSKTCTGVRLCIGLGRRRRLARPGPRKWRLAMSALTQYRSRA